MTPIARLAAAAASSVVALCPLAACRDAPDATRADARSGSAEGAPVPGTAPGAEPVQPPGGEALAAEHLRRGKALFEAGDYPRAQLAFSRARELRPGGEAETLWSDLATVARAATEPESVAPGGWAALDYLVDVLEARFPTQRHLLRTARGHLLARQGNLDGAIAAFREAVEARPGFTPALVFVAQALSRAGQAIEAEAALQVARKADPANTTARTLLARLLARRGKVDEALDVVQEALASGPTAELHALHGTILASAGRAADAEPALRAALALEADQPAALHDLGIVLAKLERNDEAIEALRKYLEVAASRGEPATTIADARATVARLRSEAAAAADGANALFAPRPRTPTPEAGAAGASRGAAGATDGGGGARPATAPSPPAPGGSPTPTDTPVPDGRAAPR